MKKDSNLNNEPERKTCDLFDKFPNCLFSESGLTVNWIQQLKINRLVFIGMICIACALAGCIGFMIGSHATHITLEQRVVEMETLFQEKMNE